MGYYCYDIAGWFTSAEIDGRNTDVAPPTTSESTVAGDDRANWTGYEWIVLPYVPFVAPAPVVPVPQSVTRFQARGALLLAGLLDDVETAMTACSDEMAKLAWKYAQEFKRDSPTIAVMAAAIGITETQLDDLFRVAAGIDA